MLGLLRNCLISAFCLLFTPVFGQEGELYFRTIAEGRGWTQNTINDILQDQDGYIWFATWSGLARYDGYDLKIFSYKQGISGGLKSNKITCIFEDSKARLWVGTNYSGFYLYQAETENFKQYFHRDDDNSLVNDNIWAIHEDRFGKLWIGTEQGLDEFDPDTETFTHYQTDSNKGNLSHPFVYSIHETSDGILWVGCETGLNRLKRDIEGNPIEFYPYDLSPVGKQISYDDELRHNFIKVIHSSQYFENTIWIGTSIGLKKFRYDPKEIEHFESQTYYHQPETGLNHQFVADLLEIETESELWIATYNGLNILDLKTGQFRYARADKYRTGSLINNTLNSLSLDKFGVVWIGTDKGLSILHLNARPFKHLDLDVEGYPNNNLTATIHPSSDGKGFWVASNGGGLSYVFKSQDGVRWKFQHFPIQSEEVQDLANFVKGIAIDPSGEMWVVTQGAGILKMQESFDKQGNKQLRNIKQYTKANQLKDDYFMSLEKAENGGFWFGYWDKGIDWYDPRTERFYHFAELANDGPNLTSFPVIDLISSIHNGIENLWVATRGNGLLQFRFEPQNRTLELLHHFKYQPNDSNGISNDFINCLYLSNPDSLWIGTENGINVLDINSGLIQAFSEEDGLPNHWIQTIGGDLKGGIWTGTQNGLCEIRIDSTNTKITTYDIYDGLRNEFFSAKKAGRSSEGELIFGTVSGLSVFHPEDIRSNDLAPQIALSEFRLFNEKVPIGPMDDGTTILDKSIAKTEEITLNYQQNVLSIGFVGLHSGESQNISYAHKLEGFDQDWVYTEANNRLAHYTNLPYRSFNFLVKAANSDGVWSEPRKLIIKMQPPFWLTHWAYLIYLTLFIGLLLGVRKLTQLRAEYRHNLQLERIEREKLEEVSQMKQQFFTNISHELRTPLTLIISPLEQLIKERNFDRTLYRAFQRMNLNANRLLTMINQLLDIQKTESGLMHLRVAKGNLTQFVEEVVLAFQGLAEQQKIKLSFEAQTERIGVFYDRDQLEKVLFNLLSNALKFTPAEGKVEVSLRLQKLANGPEEGNVLLKVKDTGMGIEEEQIAFIFDRFYQAESEYEAHRSGTGIGLSLSKNIVEAHHGKIWADSELGKGSSFYVSLPLGNAQFRKDELIKAFEDSESLQQYVQLALEPQEALIDTKESQPTELQVLLVEDNADIRLYLREKLETQYQIFEASNGRQGLELALEKVPDLIVADIAMPEMDGISLCRELKSRVETSHIPVILLTARTSLIFKIDGLETGADDYITKPFNLRLLKARINNLIESRRKLRQKFSQNWELAHQDAVLNRLDERFLQEVQKAITDNLDDSDFSVESLAESLDLSRMQLYRKLKALTDQSPNKLIRSCRLREAAKLLKTKQYNVSEVTYMVGYNDLKSFREQFKKEFGLSPSAYGEA